MSYFSVADIITPCAVIGSLVVELIFVSRRIKLHMVAPSEMSAYFITVVAEVSKFDYVFKPDLPNSM